jgi:hypothetical protein
MARVGWATQQGPSGPRGRRAAAQAVALALLAALASFVAAAAPPHPMGRADAKAAAVARSMDEAMGGQSTWESVPYIRFDFVVVKEGKELVRFRHWWDKRNGRDRVEGPDDKGRIVAAIVNLTDRKGKSFVNGMAERDSTNTAANVQNGYERWVNDTYWLMMPFKLRDPGTNLKYAGVKKGADGVEWDQLELTFDPGVGLTPKDHYWLYVNRKTHLMDKWDYLLQDMKPPAQTATWEAWTQVGPVRLSTLHRFEGKPTVLRFENVAAPASMDESIFADARPKY